MKLCYY